MHATAQAVRRLIAEVDAMGVPVRTVKGWESRGVGTLDVRGGVFHHTAGRNDLHLVTDGSWRGLNNALCNSYTSQEGELWIVARRQAWHAGRGGYAGLGRDTSAFVWGNEGESLGTSADPFTAANMRAQIALGVALHRVFGVPFSKLVDHKEWSPGRKIDRYGVVPAEFRQTCREWHTGGPLDEDETLHKGQKGPHVRAMQGEVRVALTRYNDYRKAVGRRGLDMGRLTPADGDYGPNTAKMVRYAKARLIGQDRPNGSEIHAMELAAIVRKGLDARQVLNSYADVARMEGHVDVLHEDE